MRTNESDKVKYIVVVHGMGEPRKNETVRDVIYNFARARVRDRDRDRETKDIISYSPPIKRWWRIPLLWLCRILRWTIGLLEPSIRRGLKWLIQKLSIKPRESAQPLSMGLLYGQSEHLPWIEFKEIPIDKDAEKIFLGRLNRDGSQLRFVDLFWGDITRKHFNLAGESFSCWIESLIGRLERRGNVPEWVMSLLRSLCTTTRAIQLLLRLRFQKFNEIMFNRFLGDVQIYAESAVCRGESIRRFHQTLEKVAAAHEEENRIREKSGEPARKAEYIFLAHSLGTVLSLDALLFAHASEDVRKKEQIGDTLFTGYNPALQDKGGTGGESDPDIPSVNWIKNVVSFITLGSPIDKFLVLWWNKYVDLLMNTNWMQPDLATLRKQDKIRHYNYCDEQDPVGHELNVAYSSPAVAAVFGELKDNTTMKHGANEEKFFVRYTMPGMAHIQYWKDQELFKHILGVAVDNKQDQKDTFEWFKPDVYEMILAITYKYIPFLVWICLCFLGMRLSESDNLREWIIRSVIYIGLVWLTHRIMMHIIEWRIALAKKRGQLIDEEREERGKGFTRNVKWFAYSLIAVLAATAVIRFAPGNSETKFNEVIEFIRVTNIPLLGTSIESIAHPLLMIVLAAFLVYGIRAFVLVNTEDRWDKYKAEDMIIDFKKYVNSDQSR